MRILVTIFVLLLLSASLFSQLPLTVELACDLNVKLGGCAIGDVDPDHEGNEIVAVAADGRVFVIWQAEGRWQHEVAYQATGELIQVAVGDANLERPGLEIVAVGMAKGDEDSGGPGTVVLVQKTKAGWQGEQIFEDKALVHGVAIDAGEIFCVGYSLGVYSLMRQSDSKYAVLKVGVTDAPGKNAAVNRNGLHVCCTDGQLLRFQSVPNFDQSDWSKSRTWSRTTCNRREAGRARIALAEDRMLVADDDGSLSLFVDDAHELLHHETKKLRGAAFARLEPNRVVMATVGYEGKLTIIAGRERHRTAHTIYQDPLGLHHLVAGDVNGRVGDELVTCGYAGRVIVVSVQETIPAPKKDD